MSSIIKGERIRNQSIINLSERFKALHIEYEKDEIENEALDARFTHMNEKAKIVQEPVEKPVKESEKEMISAHEEILLQARKEAALIVEEAQKQAEMILMEAQEKAAHIEEELKVQHEQFLSEVAVEKEALLEEAKANAAEIKTQAEEEKEALLKNTEGQLVEVLRQLLSHIISEEVFNNTQWLVCMVRKMLRECSTKNAINICISPKLLESLTEAQREQIEKLGEHIILEARTTLSDTSCLVETNQGNISYDVMEGLERVISEVQILERLS